MDGRHADPVPEIADLWVAYKRKPDDEKRNQLVMHYLPLVERIAYRIATSLPMAAHLENEDLVAVGVFGLLDAIKKFDLSRGLRFATFCTPRVRGAIIDELRRCDRAKRNARRAERQVTKASAEYRIAYGRNPTDTELAVMLGLPEDETRSLLVKARVPTTTSLSATLYETDSEKEVCASDLIADQRIAAPDRSTAKAEIMRLVTKGLSQQQRLVIVLYYYERLTMREISETIGASESRVSQIHKQILAHLRKRLDGRADELFPDRGV